MSKKLHNLDPLRFFLALLVVLYHIPTLSKNLGLPYIDQLAFLQKGTEAVLVFFTLSGFLIIRSLFIEKEQTGTVALGEFYMRRILRIYPVYYLVMFIGFAVYHVVFPLLEIPYDANYDVGEGILLCIFFLPNVFHVAYDPGGILTILWSIGIEEQFYLFIAPLILCLAQRHVLPFLGFFTIGFFLVYFYSPIAIFRDYYSLFFYFSFGGLLAVLNYLKKARSLLFNTPIQILLTAMVVLYFSTNLIQEALSEGVFHLVSMLLFGLFILNISYNPKPLFVIKNTTLNYFGKISYGIYMYHMIVVYAALFLLTPYKDSLLAYPLLSVIGINCIVILCTLLVAHLSFTCLEMPFLKLKALFRRTDSKSVSHKRTDLKELKNGKRAMENAK